jgi:hypothetical protein
MRQRCPWTVRAILLLGAASAAMRGAAQDLDLKLSAEHASALKYEPVNVFLTIRNDADTALVIDERAEWNVSHVTFTVLRDRTVPVRSIGERPCVERLRIDPDRKGEVCTDLADTWDMVDLGQYTVAARVDWNGRTFQSEWLTVEVVKGIEVAAVSRAVPAYPDLTRGYSLRYWPRSGTEYLFLSVDEEPTQVNYGVFALGKLARVIAPVIKVDRQGRVVIVHQSGPDCLTKSVFESSRAGVRFVDQTYHLPSGEPYPFVRRRGLASLPEAIRPAASTNATVEAPGAGPRTAD